jgi:hypothetical protein
VLFPIFSQVASVYEEYIPNVLRFYFRTEAYMASGSTVSAGLVGMATNFDPDDSTFSTMTQLENYEHGISGPPFTGVFCHDVLEHHQKRFKGKGRDLALNNYFVNSSGNTASPITNGAKFYDVGLFQQATAGCQTGLVGELWVEYSFTLIRRKQQTPNGQSLLQAHIQENPSASAAAASSKFLGTTGGTLKSGSTLPTVLTASTFTLPVQGTFLITSYWSGSVAAIASLSYGSAISAKNLLEDDVNDNRYTFSSNRCVGLAVVTVATPGIGANNTVTISGLTSLTSGTADIFINQISDGLTMRPQIFPLPMMGELAKLWDEVRHLKTLRICADSDFDDDERKIALSPAPDVNDPLSRSTLEIITEVMSRKSNSNKK